MTGARIAGAGVCAAVITLTPCVLDLRLAPAVVLWVLGYSGVLLLFSSRPAARQRSRAWPLPPPSGT